jgi:hypothetical protein
MRLSSRHSAWKDASLWRNPGEIEILASPAFQSGSGENPTRGRRPDAARQEVHGHDLSVRVGTLCGEADRVDGDPRE